VSIILSLLDAEANGSSVQREIRFFVKDLNSLGSKDLIVRCTVLDQRAGEVTYKMSVSFHSGFKHDLIVFVFFFTLSESGISFSLT
jgi:hypothetical protein